MLINTFTLEALAMNDFTPYRVSFVLNRITIIGTVLNINFAGYLNIQADNGWKYLMRKTDCVIL